MDNDNMPAVEADNSKNHNRKTSNIFNLKNLSRRHLIKTLAASGTGIAGLISLIEQVAGESVDGKPIVYTYDEYNNPETVRMVPKQRYDRLKDFSTFDVGALQTTFPVINGVTIMEQSNNSEDLGLVFFVSEISDAARERLPDQFLNMPVKLQERSGERKPAGICTDGCRAGTYYGTMQGNIQISANSSDSYSRGPICAAGYDSNDGDKLS